MWTRIIYYPNSNLKTHILSEGLKDIVASDNKANHNADVVESISDEVLYLDPGGMISLKSIPLTTIIDDKKISIKPEHILDVTYRWSKFRELSEKTSLDEKIIKVYLSEFTVVVVPESLYNKIGFWLAMSQGEGQVGTANLMEALKSIPNVLLLPPKTKGDA